MASALVDELARRQLEAYNRADLDAFCTCYHPDVVVLEHRGEAAGEPGLVAFRARYAAMFAAHRDVRGEVTERLVLAPHIVERERWSRTHRDTGAVTSGEVLVRYTEAEGLLRWVEFLAP